MGMASRSRKSGSVRLSQGFDFGGGSQQPQRGLRRLDLIPASGLQHGGRDHGNFPGPWSGTGCGAQRFLDRLKGTVQIETEGGTGARPSGCAYL